MTNYLAIAALGMCLAGTAGAADPPAQPATAKVATGGTRYVQASTGSSLAFTFTQLDAASTGQFKTFATEFQYDEANPAQGSLLVRVMMDSVDTQDAERDSTLKSEDLFDTRAHPAATYVARTLARNASGGLEAVGKLTIRGISRDLRLPLSLTPTARGLELSGQATIRRLDFGVGQGEWKSTESVGDEVKIQYKVALVKAPAGKDSGGKDK
jgi:polyisoprenoid-binding protein YceI